MSSCVRVAISDAVDFGSCGCFSLGALGLRPTSGLPGSNSGASACKLAEATDSASSSVVNCPPNWRPPAAVRCKNRCAPPLPGPPRPRCPPLVGADADAELEASLGIVCRTCDGTRAWPPRPLPRPRPLLPPLCDCCSPFVCPSFCASGADAAFDARLRLRLRGRLPRELVSAPPDSFAGACVVATVDMLSGGGATTSNADREMFGGSGGADYKCKCLKRNCRLW